MHLESRSSTAQCIKRAPRAVVPEGSPFSDDKFDRKIIADNLSRLITGSSEPLTIAICAPWGNGKTFFIHRWASMLRSMNVQTILFNAWEQDYASDPLVAFISAIERLINAHPKRVALDSLKKDLRQKASRVIRLVGRTAVEYATRGALNRAIDEEAAGALSGMLGAVVQDELDRQQSIGESVKQFKSTLAQFAKEISVGNAPLVFFIDELDRCRPDYTVSFLENMKHLFDVDGVTFVLSVDRDQLISNIKASFGAGLDGDGYLRRFFDFQFHLPRASQEAFCKSLSAQFKIRNSKSNTFGEIAEEMASVLSVLANNFGFSLRATEQCFTRFHLAYSMSERPKWWYISNATLLLIAIYEYDISIFERIIQAGDEMCKGIVELLDRANLRSLLRDRSVAAAFGELLAIFTPAEQKTMPDVGAPTSDASNAFLGVKRHHGYTGFVDRYLSVVKGVIQLTTTGDS